MTGERRALQLAVATASIVPLLAGGAGMIGGADFIASGGGVGGGGGGDGADLDSHMRYLSGLLFAIGLGFVTAIPRIETHRTRFRLLGALVVTGGLARLAGLALADALPGTPHLAALVMELVVTPTLVLWQGRVAAQS